MTLDWGRLHAALNDLPAALLLAAVLFDLLGAINKRESLKAAGFWCLVGGVLGGGLAALAGEMAEEGVAHSDAAHELLELHETLAWVVLGTFGVLLAWRLVRRSLAGRQQAVFSAAGVLGTALLVFTARLGGSLVFDHAAGLSNHQLQHIQEQRQGGHAHEGGEEGEEGEEGQEGEVHEHQHGAENATPMPRDSAAARHDSTEHRH